MATSPLTVLAKSFLHPAKASGGCAAAGQGTNMQRAFSGEGSPFRMDTGCRLSLYLLNQSLSSS